MTATARGMLAFVACAAAATLAILLVPGSDRDPSVVGKAPTPGPQASPMLSGAHLPAGPPGGAAPASGAADASSWSRRQGDGRRAMIRGKVTRSDGSPAPEGTQVFVREARPDPAPGVDAADRLENGPSLPAATDGTFQAEDLSPGTYRVRAQFGCAPSVPVRVAVVPGEIVEGLVLALPPYGTLRGVVEDVSGRPLEGVGLEAVSDRGTVPDDVRSGPDGSFAFEGLPDADYRVRAQVSGVFEALGRPDGVGLRLALPAAPMARTLLVRDPEGNPVPEADVHVMSGENLGDVRMEAASPTGRGTYEIPRRALGRYCAVRVLRPRTVDGVPLNLLGVTVWNVAPRGSPLEVVLPAGREVRGRVVDEGGAPVSDVLICLNAEREGRVQPRGEDEASVDVRFHWRDPVACSRSDGTFEVGGVPRGRLRVRALPTEGREPGRWVEVPAEGEVVVLVRPGGVVDGRVLGPDGSPAVGAEVTASADGSGYGFENWACHTETDASGGFRLVGVPRDVPFVLTAAMRGRGRWYPYGHVRDVRAGDREVTVRIEEAATSAVEGIATFPDGTPVGGGFVAIRYVGEDLEGLPPAVEQVDRDGTFRLLVPEGQEIRIAFGRAPMRRQPDRPVAHAPSDWVAVQAPATGVTLRLATAVDLTGRVVGPWEPGLAVYWTTEHDERTAVVSRAGGFALHGLRDDVGTLWVTGGASGSCGVLRTIRPSAGPVVVPLSPGATLRGRVTLPPMFTVADVLVRGPGIRSRVDVRWDGSFTCAGVPEGTYDVRARVDGRSGRRAMQVATGTSDALVPWDPPER